jgi:hypothetical protein
MGMVSPPAIFAQGLNGSRNLPVDHWAYESIQRLRTRGYLAGLNPLIQPYRRIAVARALLPLHADSLRAPVAHWVRLLRQEFAREIDRLEGGDVRAWGLQVTGGARASTSQRLDVLRPLGDGDVWPRYTGAVWAETGPLAFESRIEGDFFLEDDPDGLSPGQGRGGRSGNSYLSLGFEYGGVILGRFQRNWSMLGTKGFMVSDVPTSYPQLGLEARIGRFTLHSTTGELDTLVAQKRYLAAHRIDYATDDLVISLGNSVLYATDKGLQLRYLNPVELQFFDQDKEPNDVVVNATLELQLWYRWRGLELYGRGLLDDFDINPDDDDGAPARYAFSIGARVPNVLQDAELDVSYRQVSAFAYRSFTGLDDYTFLARSLGDPVTDYSRLEVAMHVFPNLTGLRLTPSVAFQRKGEGNLGDPTPIGPEFRASPPIFLGTVEQTYRVALAGRYEPNRYFWLTWDLGQNFLRNALHVAGINDSEFSANAAVGFTLELPR